MRAERFGVRAMIGGREPHVSLVEALRTDSVPVMRTVMGQVPAGQALFGEATHFVSHSRREEFALLVDGLERYVFYRPG